MSHFVFEDWFVLPSRVFIVVYTGIDQTKVSCDLPGVFSSLSHLETFTTNFACTSPSMSSALSYFVTFTTNSQITKLYFPSKQGIYSIQGKSNPGNMAARGAQMTVGV